MSSKAQKFSVGKTQTFSCSYLSEEMEQLLVIQEQGLDPSLFEQLLSLGFRRSGSTIYRPDCPHCNACLPIRIPVNHFKPSKRQKRTLNNNKDVNWTIVDHHTEQHYALYERYINERHRDGGMYPPSPEQYHNFISSTWLSPMLIELTLDDKLIGVAVTDILPNSFSAIYSFFEPDEHKRSLGSFLILLQCRIAKMMQKEFLYLGYQIDKSRKMAYKRDYNPHQILTSSGWNPPIPSDKDPTLPPL
ncbi:arginyltransferase [Shewanella surugensis]|uniref:Aspartate/glutamate leucyltransferase n=1 Tax=Shewanella surugensis TaxID=212020 RepID=A0ABT0LH55_9GAMM|nr:arginyltransferase [Shewanella surugensis]MCL1126780.1 arginyltransferase [Shewanella surugensis]